MPAAALLARLGSRSSAGQVQFLRPLGFQMAQLNDARRVVRVVLHSKLGLSPRNLALTCQIPVKLLDWRHHHARLRQRLVGL